LIRIGIIADVHADVDALQAALARLATGHHEIASRLLAERKPMKEAAGLRCPRGHDRHGYGVIRDDLGHWSVSTTNIDVAGSTARFDRA